MKYKKKKFYRPQTIYQMRIPKAKPDPIEGDLSFEAHDDATHWGCKMCGNEWKSLNAAGYCSSCWVIWNS